MRFVVVAVGVVVSLYCLHRLALYAEFRGWVYYKTRPPRVRMLGMIEELVDPRVEYMIEEESSDAIRADHSETGDPERPHTPG